MSRSGSDARAREVRIRGTARPPSRVRGVALGRLDGCRGLVPHYYRRAQRARRCCKPGRPRTLREQLHFAETISRYLTRPALPDPVNEVLAPFVKRIAEKHGRESAEGQCAHKVSELRVEATPEIDYEEPALNVLMILGEDDLPCLPEGSQVDDDRINSLIGAGRTAAAEAVHQAGDPVTKREAWMALAECWIKPAVELLPAVDGVGSVEITVLNGEEFSYARSLSAPILDLRYLSTRAA